MKNKQPFTISGSVALKKALLEETGAKVFSPQTVDATYIRPSFEHDYLCGCPVEEETHYQLPQDWDKAIQAVKDFFAEDEGKPQTLVLKDVRFTKCIEFGSDNSFQLTETIIGDMELTDTHLQQLKAYFSK
jgi:hypothetical protein